jgi:hypothetical protein
MKAHAISEKRKTVGGPQKAGRCGTDGHWTSSGALFRCRRLPEEPGHNNLRMTGKRVVRSGQRGQSDAAA